MPPTATEQQTETVTFMAQGPDLLLARRQADFDTDHRGKVTRRINQRTDIREGEEENRRREHDGLDPLPIDRSPWSVQFENHIFKTDDPVLLEFLRGHDLFNKKFWEEGAAPDEPKPTITEQTARLSKASVRQDTEEINALLAEERETHNRTPIIQAAEAALREIADEAEEPEAHGEGEPWTPPSSPPE